MMNRAWVATFACVVGMACHAQEVSDGTLGGMLRGYLRMSEAACPKQAASLADAKAKGDAGQIIVLRQYYQTMCVCHPEKTRALLKSLPAAKLSAPAQGDNDFQSVANPGIQEPCIGEQLDAFFSGESCDGFKSTDIKPGTQEADYCACMSKEMAGWSDKDAAAMFLELGSFKARFRSAKTRNSPRPLPDPPVDRYIESLNRCGGGLEFKD